MRCSRIMLVFHHAIVIHDCLRFVVGWNLLLSSRDTNPDKITVVDRRTAVAQKRALVGAALGLSSLPGSATATTTTTTTTTVVPLVTESLPMLSRSEKFGVLWRTDKGEALPATPSNFLEIMNSEVLGSALSSTDSTGIVCVSERHDDFEHHKVQLKILMTMRKALKERAREKTMAVGMEMFQRRHQPFLDRFIAANFGEGENDYSLHDLKRDTNWDNTWGYDMLHYAPLLLFARKHGVRVLGLHPSDELVDLVKDRGLVALPPSALVGTVCTNDKRHREDFERAARSQYSDVDVDCLREAFDRCVQRDYEVQCFREEYMAESVARHMAHKPDSWVAILAGERHIVNRVGLPLRASRRVAASRATVGNGTRTKSRSSSSSAEADRSLFTIIPRTISFPMVTKDAPGPDSADYVWYVERDPSVPFNEYEVNMAPRNSARTS